MHIGAFIRGLVGGEPRTGDVKELELRSGQVVSGLVLESSDNEALVQINGAQVRAKLEVPLQPGMRTLLVVQPETNNGLPVLKQADSLTGQMTAETLKDLVKSLGLPADKQWPQDLVRQLQKDGVPLTKELGEALAKALSAMPKGADEGKWMQAAATAFQRGLPMTPAVLSGLHQVMSGRPVHELLDQLQTQLKAWSGDLQSGPGQLKSGGPAAEMLVARLQTLLGEGDALLRSAGTVDKNQPRTGAGGVQQQTQADSVLSQQTGRGQAAAAGSSPLGSGAAVLAGENGQAQQNGQSGLQPAQTAQHNGATVQQGVQTNTSGQQAVQMGQNVQQPVQTAQQSLQTGQIGQQSQANQAVNQPGASAVPPNAGGEGNPAVQNNTGTVAATNQAAVGGRQDNGHAASSTGINQTGQPASPAPSSSGGWIGDLFKWLGVNHERQITREFAAAPAPGSGQAHSAAAQAPTSSGQGAASGAAGNPAAASQARNEGGQMIQQESARPAGSQESAVAGSRASGASAVQTQTSHHAALERAAAGQQPLSLQPGQAAESLRSGGGAESLKSALLMLASSNDAPAGLRETAQQLVQHITGQQLLLAPERGNSLFSHVAMVIPFYNEQGGQTAAIHIQTRRGRKGELDSQNCRLLFDLQMKQLGDTLIDVQVVDRMVTLQVWNNHPATEPLLEASRAEMGEALQQSGYKLLSLKTQPMPEADGTASLASGQQSGLSTAFVSKPYKGMDLRV